ncbi:hypothetical protein TrLO_g1553 [Triparma laevis f. longispina]|uniref:Annexin n=1 Tax=Triparma laevis f. longispina TaxID=1714387 RepID=A0A9W7FUE5_9STRA|nr:hypothetical protein TrLO_g1553 [Triparma laevis f. longispina]
MEALMQQIMASRMDLQQKIQLLITAASYYRWMQTTVAKENTVLQWCMKELNNEMVLSAELEYHIAKQDAQDVFMASDGFGTDEEKMGVVIIGRRPESIRITDAIYQKKHNRTLEDQVRGENKTLVGMLTGKLTDFGKFLAYRTMPRPHLIALLVHKCCKGMGTSDYTLMEVLSTNSNVDLRASVAVYAEMFEGEDMVERIKKETDGMLSRNYGKWAAKLCEFERDETEDVPDNVDELAERLYAAGAKKMMGCNEDEFLEILNAANVPTIEAIKAAYPNVTDGRDFIADVKKKMSGNLEFAVVARLTPKYEFLAARLKKACDGMGTDEDAICRVLGSSTNEECLFIRDAFAEVFEGEDLVELMKSELSGNFLKMVQFLYKVDPPKGHWRDPATYAVDAANAGVEFMQQLQMSFNPAMAAMEGQQPMFSPLSFVGFMGNPFIIPGCDTWLPPSSPPFVPMIDQNYLLNSPVADLASGQQLLTNLQMTIQSTMQMTDMSNMASNGLQPQYLQLAYSIRAASAHCLQLKGDNMAMLEFVAQRDAVMVHEACEGWGTDEESLILILTAQSKPQMKRVSEIYEATHGKTLTSVLDGELSGFFGGSTDFQYFMNCLVQDPATLDAQFLVESMKGWGTDEKLLSEIICTRNNLELAQAKAAFQRDNGKSVEQWVTGDTSGLYQRFLLECLKGQRREGMVDPTTAESIADRLWNAGLSAGNMDTFPDRDEAVLIDLTANTGAEQMKLVDQQMTAKYGKSLNEAIKDAMGGDIEDAMRVRSLDKFEYFAEALNKAWEGFGTDEQATSRIMGRYSKTELKQISARYEASYGKSVKSGIESECSGNYKKALIAYLYREMPGYTDVVPRGTYFPLGAGVGGFAV